MNKKSFTTLFWISVSVGLFTFVFLNNREHQTAKYLAINVSVAALYSFVIAYGNWGLNYFLSKRFSWIENTRERAIYGIVGAVFINIILVLGCNYVNFIIIQGGDPQKFLSGSMLISHILTINICFLISAILHAKDFMEEWKKAAKQQVTEQKIIAKSANAQFESLKNQLDPHFLFNSLNVLSALIDENPNQAQQFTSSMSKVYRYVLDQKDKELVTVEEELDFAKTYCELLKTRFEDAVDFQCEVSDEAKKMYVVPLSLQLLLENAIKHNYATSGKPLMIKIYSESHQLIIENNLQQREIVKDREGIGLANIVQRYSVLTKENVTIDQGNEKFKVKIPMLIEKISAMNLQTTNRDLAYEKAAKRVQQIKKFYGSLAAYCIVIPFLFFLNWRDDSKQWWAFWPALGWGIGLAIQAIQTFGIGKDWEEKKINELMKKYENYGN